MPEIQTNLAWDTLLGPLDGGPLHRRLAEQLRAAIRQHRIPPGAALPPSRLLAAELGCSRWVVTEAYGQLAAEGYLRARSGSVTRVCHLPVNEPLTDTSSRPLRPPASRRVRYDLVPGLPDLGAFPRRAWAEALAKALTDMPDADFGARPRAGHPRLRAVLAEYLRRVRGAHVDDGNLVVCRGVSDGIRLVCQALKANGIERIGIEEPGWSQVRQAATRAGLDCVPIAVDEHGIRVTDLEAHGALRAVVVTPAHQFPTGAVLGQERRARLIQWAEAVDGLILEDDYDSEFRYDRAPIGVLQGIAPERVVLHGSVSKTLSPALGLGWLAVPASWRSRVLGGVAPVDSPATPDQLAFARFVESGQYDRTLRRARRRYRTRRAALIEALHRHLPQARVTGAEAGLHLLLELGDAAAPDPDWSVRVERAAARHSVRISPLDFHRSQPGHARALVVGYGDLPDHAADDIADLLRRILQECGTESRSLRTRGVSGGLVT